MRLQNKHDGTFLVISVREYHENHVYYRANYIDVTPASSPKQIEQRANYIKLGQLSSLRSQLRHWRDTYSRKLTAVQYVAACDTIDALTRQIIQLTATMKGNKS